MLGEKRMDSQTNFWFGELKVSIIKEDFSKIEKITRDELPRFSSLDEIVEAKYLLREAMVLAFQKRNSLSHMMDNVSRNLELAIDSISNPYHRFNKQF